MAIKGLIDGGPSREDLFDALRLVEEQRQITLTFTDDTSNEFLLVGIEYSNSCRQEWTVRLRSVSRPRDLAVMVYSTRTRTGSFHWEKPRDF